MVKTRHNVELTLLESYHFRIGLLIHHVHHRTILPPVFSAYLEEKKLDYCHDKRKNVYIIHTIV